MSTLFNKYKASLIGNKQMKHVINIKNIHKIFYVLFHLPNPQNLVSILHL